MSNQQSGKPCTKQDTLKHRNLYLQIHDITKTQVKQIHHMQPDIAPFVSLYPLRVSYKSEGNHSHLKGDAPGPCPFTTSHKELLACCQEQTYDKSSASLFPLTSFANTYTHRGLRHLRSMPYHTHIYTYICIYNTNFKRTSDQMQT